MKMPSFTFRQVKTVIKPLLIGKHSQINQQPIRVRFAPSPTGFLHLGGLRTALYNHLFAKSRNGKFILRIEDTDQTRLVEGAVEQLQRDLSWSGIEIHEGPEIGGNFAPYVQSQRLNIYNPATVKTKLSIRVRHLGAGLETSNSGITLQRLQRLYRNYFGELVCDRLGYAYKEHVQTLLENGSAYHCFCTERRLELLRKEALRAREVPKYDNRCRNLSTEQTQEKLAQGAESCIRFKLSSGAETFNDLIYGTITYDIAGNEGDPVIIKSDDFPTYHFANVVDDHLMQISHVLRGVEWQISTTKHLLMYRAFKWEPPFFGHLPLLMNPDGSKLSKRQGDIKISHYRDTGIFPLALINFIVNLGGGFEKDTERHVKPKCRTIEELTEQFDISRINSHSGKLMPERLSEFNRLELKRKLRDANEEQDLVEKVRQMVKSHFSDHDELELSSEHVKSILNWSVNRITKLSDLLSSDLKFIWVSPKNYKMNNDELSYIKILTEDFAKLEVLNKDDLNQFFRNFSERHQLKFGYFMKTLRSVLSGLKEGPSVAEMIEILGKENTVDRLQCCLKQQVR